MPSTLVYLELGCCHSFLFVFSPPKAGVPAPTNTPTDTEINLSANSCLCSAWRERGAHSQNSVLCNCLQLIKEGILLEVPLATLQLTTYLFALADCRHFAWIKGGFYLVPTSLVKNWMGNWMQLRRSLLRDVFLLHEFNIFAIWELSAPLSCILSSVVLWIHEWDLS